MFCTKNEKKNLCNILLLAQFKSKNDLIKFISHQSEQSHQSCQSHQNYHRPVCKSRPTDMISGLHKKSYACFIIWLHEKRKKKSGIFCNILPLAQLKIWSTKEAQETTPAAYRIVSSTSVEISPSQISTKVVKRVHTIPSFKLPIFLYF